MIGIRRYKRMRIKLAILTALAAVFFVCPTAVAAEAPAEVHTGVYSDDFDSSGDLNGISAAAGQRVTFAGTFHDAYEASPSYDPTDVNSWSNTVGILEGVWAGKATPFANFDIKASAASIAAGNHDTQIAQWVRHVKAWLARGGGRSLIVAPFQEHNGKWTPYGCNPTAFRTAYAKVVDAFHAAGVGETKVRFAWAPNGWTSPGCGSLADYYPGDDLVDVVSVSGYNWVACPGSLGYETPAQAIGTWFDEIRTTLPGTYVKPFLVAQTASPNSGCQAHWMTSLVNFLDADPNAVGFVWFNFNKPGEPDFRVWAGTLAQGWKDAVATGTTAYRWPLASWFAPGPLVAVGATPPPPPCVKAPCDTIAAVDAGSRFGVWDALDYPHLKNWFYFGNPGDLPFMGDWDGDGEATPGLYRQSDGFVYVRDTNTQGVADRTFYFGNPGDVPLVGDFDGDGRDSVSIWRASEARIYIINELGEDGKGLGAADHAYGFGNPGDQPFVGDFDGDGIDTVGLYRQSTGFVYFRNSLSTGVAHFSFFYGNPGDSIFAGDWDGDGDDTVAVYRPATGLVYMNLENSAGVADWTGYVGRALHVVTAGMK